MKTKNIITYLFIAMIIIISGLYVNSQFNVIDETVLLPEYFSGQCIERADSMSEIDIGDVSNDGEFFSCVTGEFGKYIPEVNGVECRFYVDEGFTHTAYDCPLGTSESQVTERCEKLSGFFEFQDKETRYTIDAGRELYINPTSFLGFGTTTIKAEIPSYGLQFQSPQGFIYPTTENCVANSRDNDLRLIEKSERFEVIPDSPINAIVGKSEASSTSLVVLDDVAGGSLIFIERPGYYYLVKETVDGALYVDIKGGIRSDEDIECIPRTFGCSDDAKVVSITEQSCSDTGLIIGYSPVEGNNDKLCKYDCVDGILSLTNDCIDVAKSCPDNTPLWDAETGECVAVEDFEVVRKDVDTFNLRIFVATVIISLIVGGIIFGITRTYARTKFLRRFFVIISIISGILTFFIVPNMIKGLIDIFKFMF